MSTTLIPRLVALSGPLAQTVVSLDQEETTIGRGVTNAVCIADPILSRQHCVIAREDDQFLIRDLGSLHGTVVTTNLDNGGTYTNVFTSNSQDHAIVDNGDGTITITSFGSGGSRFYDTNGNLVLKDPGEVRFAFDIDYNGTPGDPEDDTDVPNSFRMVRASTGNSDFSDRDFCADLVTFTS